MKMQALKRAPFLNLMLKKIEVIKKKIKKKKDVFGNLLMFAYSIHMIGTF